MSKSIRITLSHDLGADEARRRIEAGLESLRKRFADKIADASVAWSDYHAAVRVSALGQTADVGIDVGADLVAIELQLPWLLAAFADKVRALVEKSGSDALRLPPPR